MEYNGLNEAQAEAVRSNHHRILCLAGAGTGKTRVLTHRTARLYEDGVKPEEMLALTFTRAAGAEMKERIINLIGEDGRGIFCNTFHAWAVQLIRQYAYRLGYTPTFSIYDTEDKTAIIELIIKELQYRTTAKKVLDAMDKNILHRVPFPEGDIANIVKEYTFRCKKQNAIDLDGLISSVGYLLQDDTIANAVRERWPYIFVDEFQDTDHRQMEILNTINPQNLFVVGDDFQSIYKFRGADVTIIMDMAEDPEYEVVKLEENYRSTEPIVTAANKLIKHNNQTEKILRNDRKGPEIVTFNAEDTEAELQNVTFIIKSLHETLHRYNEIACRMEEKHGIAYKDIAILGRTNKQIQAASEALTMAGIPNVVKTKSADVMESQEAKKLFAWMEAILNPKNDVAIDSVLNWPRDTIQPKERQQVEMFMLTNDCSLKTALETTESAIGFLDIYSGIHELIWENYDTEEQEEISAFDLLDFIIAETQILEDYHEKGLENRVRIVNEIMAQVSKWQTHQIDIGEPATATAWLERYNMRMMEAVQEDTEQEDAVQIMTAHGSKGLEYEVVIIIGCNNKSFPLGFGDMEEERRLFYVAITRAKSQLFLTRANQTTTWGDKTQPTEASIFIDEMK